MSIHKRDYEELNTRDKMCEYLLKLGAVFGEETYYAVLEHYFGNGFMRKTDYSVQEVSDIMKIFFPLGNEKEEIVSKKTSTKKQKETEKQKKNNTNKGACRSMYDTEKWLNIIDEIINPEEHCDEHGVFPKKISDYPLKETDKITVPSKMDFYTGLDINEKDRIEVDFAPDSGRFNSFVLLINGDDTPVGIFAIKTYITDENEVKCFLVAYSEKLNFGVHENTKYFFAFSDTTSACNIYKVPIEVSYQETQTASTHLCIDFGTSNTTVGCFLDDKYVDNVSNLAVINENVRLNHVNITKFPITEPCFKKDRSFLSYNNLSPTIVYVDGIKDGEIEYLFGHEAARRIKDDNYCPKASCFMEIKRWTSNMNVNEELQDADGNKATVSRKDIIAAYLKFVIRESENQFKCKFKNIHISAPVKLKEKVLDIYADVLAADGYVLEKDHAIDEGIAVLYSIISNQIKDNNYENGVQEKALIIDCGGGTSDLASCSYTIEKDEDGIINLDINTEYMNGDVNFGGNNLTYRIMQYMKIVYVAHYEGNGRLGIDQMIDMDVNALFSYIEGELENDDDVNVKARYEDVYKTLNESYNRAEEVIPTRYKDYENKPKEIYDKVKNNFYFLWKLAEEMKKEFYRSTSISRYTFEKERGNNTDIDLHINQIPNWRLSMVNSNGEFKEEGYPDVTFTAKEIDKLLRADIYYLVRKFLNGLYIEKKLDDYSQIKLSGQSSKINIFMESLKEFLPGKKIKSGRIHSKGNDAEELKLLCLKGAVMYLHALEKSNIEVELRNDTKNIPISVYIKNENDEDKRMFEQGEDWGQPAVKRRITNGGKEIYLHMRNVDKEIGEPYKYVYENVQYKEVKFNDLKKICHDKISQEEIDNLPKNKKYIYVFLDKERWGFNIIPVYTDDKGKIYRGDVEFCSFEMDILQETFFDGRK